MIRINLLQIKEELRRAAITSFLTISGLSVVLMFGVAFAIHGGITGDIDERTTQNQQLEAEIQKLTNVIGEVEKIKKQTAELEAKLHTIQGLEVNRKYNVELFNELERLMPQELWLDSMALEGAKLTIKGKSVDNQIIGEFYTALDQSRLIDNLSYGPSVQKPGPGSLKLYEFEVVATVVALTAENFVSEADLEEARK